MFFISDLRNIGLRNKSQLAGTTNPIKRLFGDGRFH
jgi:hypothetical protein